MMRAIRFSEYGDPRARLSLANVPDLQPGENEVRVRMTHRPINPADLLIVKGIYPVQPKPPMSPGLEGLGRIDALGAKVTGLNVGQRVISLAVMPGTWAEQMVIPAALALPVPDSLADNDAAQLLANPLSAWALLYDELPIQAGDWFLQTAASSALGRIVIQMARRSGIRTLNIVRRQAHVRQVLDAGGDAVICTENESVTQRVREIAGDAGVGFAIDAVGGALGAEVAACLRPGGTLLPMGLLSGNTLGPIDAAALIFKRTTIRGFWVVEWAMRRPPELVNRGLTEIIGMISAGELRLRTEAEYDLADFARAIDHASRPARDGKVMLVG